MNIRTIRFSLSKNSTHRICNIPKILDTIDRTAIHTEHDPQAMISDEEHNQSYSSGHNDNIINEGQDNANDEGNDSINSSNSTDDVPTIDVQSADKSTIGESLSSKAGRKLKRTKGDNHG